MSLVTVGQYDGTVPGVVDLSVTESNQGSIQADALKPSGKNCTNVPVTVYTNKNKVWVKVQVKNQHANYLLNSKMTKMIVHINDTPIGFNSTGNIHEPYICTKTPVSDITKEGFKCFIANDTGVILRPPPKWLGYYESPDSNASGFILHNHCPFEFCRKGPVYISINSTYFSQDNQCNHNRSGILCGQCKQNYSRAIGSRLCIDCMNYPLKKTVGWSVMFAVAGMVIILIVLLTNFTVTQGTMSEFLFSV